MGPSPLHPIGTLFVLVPNFAWVELFMYTESSSKVRTLEGYFSTLLIETFIFRIFNQEKDFLSGIEAIH